MWSKPAGYLQWAISFRPIIFSLLCLWGVASHAIVVDNLYQAKVPVSGSGEEARKQALAQALKQVAVKVSGLSTAASRPVVEQAASNAQQYVVQFAYVGDAGAERMLQASFVSGAIDKILAEASLPIWGSNRPALVTWLAIDQNGQRDLLGSEAYAALTGALEQRARERGVPLVIPLMDLEDSGNISANDVWQMALEPAQKASSRYSHDAVLLGRVFLEAGGQWQGQWQLHMQGETFSDTVTAASTPEVLQALVDSVAERLASRYAVSGGGQASGSIELEVSGINSVQDYATLSRYLSGLAPVRSAQPVVVEGDKIRYRLMLKGPVSQVQEYMALERRLQPQAGSMPPGSQVQTQQAQVQKDQVQIDSATLYYRWQP